jgi:hypothetical protein
MVRLQPKSLIYKQLGKNQLASLIPLVSGEFTKRMENCESCGMPMDEMYTSKLDAKYCIYCQDQDTGRMATRQEVREGCIGAAMKIMDESRENAEKIADKLIPKLPRWKEK